MVARRLLAALAAFVLVLGTGAVALASPAAESEFVTLINQARSAQGLPALTVHGDLVAGARSHTAEMVPTGTIFHSTSAQLSSVTTGWSVMGENVGKGPNPTVLHRAFMESPSHRANVLGDFDRVGVGVAADAAGKLYVTVMFMKSKAAPVPTTTTTPPSPTTTAPPPPTTTTTAPASPAPEPAPTRPSAPAVERETVPRTLGLEVFSHPGWVDGTWCVTIRADGSICVD